jgi:hypothetical protein
MLIKKYRLFILSVLLFISSNSIGQSLDSLVAFIKVIQKGQNDSSRIAANTGFYTGLENILKLKGSFNRNFDSLNNISVISPEDKSFRIYTWVLPHYDGEKYDYFGFLQVKSKTSDSIQLFPLHDSTEVIDKPESEKLSPDRWLGAVYYAVETTVKSNTSYYTLFGWKGVNSKQTQKMLDVFVMNKNKPQFGYPLFKSGSVYKNRMLYTFDAQASMVLHYDKNYDGIVSDHIAQSKKMDRLVTGPDGTYDGFRWKKGKWLLYKDIDVRTKWEPEKNLPVSPEERPRK